MQYRVVYQALAVGLALWAAVPAFATDLNTPKPRHKRAHVHHHRALQKPPGAILAVDVARPPTCNTAWPFHYPNYKQASCHDYSGFATVYDPRSPDGVAVYGFRALYGLH